MIKDQSKGPSLRINILGLNLKLCSDWHHGLTLYAFTKSLKPKKYETNLNHLSIDTKETSKNLIENKIIFGCGGMVEKMRIEEFCVVLNLYYRRFLLLVFFAYFLYS